MEQYISKSALVVEIKKRIKSTNNDIKIGAIESLVVSKTLNSLISFINTLEVKDVDLEEETDKWYNNEASKEFENVLYKDIEKCAKHFFELGLLSTITEEDCKLIWNIGDEIPYMPEEDFFKELLRRYKAQKGEEV